jgi:hypothetical protein
VGFQRSGHSGLVQPGQPVELIRARPHDLPTIDPRWNASVPGIHTPSSERNHGGHGRVNGESTERSNRLCATETTIGWSSTRSVQTFLACTATHKRGIKLLEPLFELGFVALHPRDQIAVAKGCLPGEILGAESVRFLRTLVGPSQRQLTSNKMPRRRRSAPRQTGPMRVAELEKHCETVGYASKTDGLDGPRPQLAITGWGPRPAARMSITS